jgi:hypothetical protein
MSRAAPPSRRIRRQRRFAILAVLALVGGPALSATHLCLPDEAHDAPPAAMAEHDCQTVAPTGHVDDTLCSFHCASQVAAKQHADAQAPPSLHGITAPFVAFPEALAPELPSLSPVQAVCAVRWRLQHYCVLLI